MSSKNVRKAAVIGTKQLEEQISRLNYGNHKNHWKIKTRLAADGSVENRLEVDYKFKSFAKTWSFLNLVAYHADNAKHHPSIDTTYNKVNIKLTTHDAGNRVTYNDLKFAQFVKDEFEREFERPQNVIKMDKLLKEARGQFSFSQASQIIDDLVASNKSTDSNPTKEDHSKNKN